MWEEHLCHSTAAMKMPAPIMSGCWRVRSRPLTRRGVRMMRQPARSRTWTMPAPGLTRRRQRETGIPSSRSLRRHLGSLPTSSKVKAERLVKPASDGDWGIVEILPHIGDWEEVAAFWTKRILNEDTPALEAVDDSLWAIEHDYAREDPFEALERFAQMRYALVQVLEGLDDEDWRRTGIHAVRGEMTLHQFVDRMCDHDARYLAQARDALT